MYRNYFRAIYISYKLLKHKNNIAKALEELGPAFIKLGQFLSTRPDLIGEDLSLSFDYLRDNLPSFSFDQVKKIIQEELKNDLDKLFQDFDPNPIAAASIAQIHQAITKDGKKVAVKIRRPNIDKILAREIKFFYFIARKIEFFFPKYKRLKLTKVVETLENSFKLELDLRLEAAAADELLHNNKLAYVRIPKIDWLYTGEKVMTMEWIDAISIYNREKLQEFKIDLKKLTNNLAISFFSQAFIDGFFHADLHQGNIMVDKNANIVLLDFGIMGRLAYKERIYIAQILYGFLERDYKKIARIHIQAGYVSKRFMIEQFAQSCRAIGEPIMNLPADKISIAKLLGQLFKVTEDFQMETQPQLLLLQKTMIMVEGIGKILCPQENLWILSESWIKEWAKNNISIEARLAKIIKKIALQIIEKIEQE